MQLFPNRRCNTICKNLSVGCGDTAMSTRVDICIAVWILRTSEGQCTDVHNGHNIRSVVKMSAMSTVQIYVMFADVHNVHSAVISV